MIHNSLDRPKENRHAKDAFDWEKSVLYPHLYGRKTELRSWRLNLRRSRSYSVCTRSKNHRQMHQVRGRQGAKSASTQSEQSQKHLGDHQRRGD